MSTETAPRTKFDKADVSLWIHRDTFGLSSTELDQTAALFDKERATVKTARFSLSLIVPAEMIMALAPSRLPEADIADIQQQVFNSLPDTSHRPVVAVTSGLVQLGPWISIAAEYDSFAEERESIVGFLNERLGIRHIWSTSPHIGLAKGNIRNLSGRKEIEASLPEYIQLSEPIFGKNGDGTRLR